jgi:glycosyltransferase involved in cell wall biosynthesis
MSNRRQQKLFIDASVLTVRHKSGIAKVTLSLIQELCQQEQGRQIVIFAPFDTARAVKDSVSYPVKKIPIPDILFRALKKYDLLPPLDLFLGRGIYFFPNYWNSRLILSHSITMVYDLGFLLFPSFVETKNRRYLSRNISRWTHRTSRVVTISEYVASQLRTELALPPAKVKVMYLGVDQKHFKPVNENDIKILRSKLGLNKRYILTVGNIEPRKGLDTLVEAYRALDATLHDAYSLVIVGAAGWNNESIEEQIHDIQQAGLDIRVLSGISDRQLPALYSGASVYVQASRYEGFGLTPLEAAACGAPLLLSDIPVFREVFGSDADYAPPDNYAAFQNSLSRILSKEHPSANRLYRSALPRRFTWPGAVSQLLDITNETAGQSGGTLLK